MNSKYRKVMVFGRSGSGKTTFGVWLGRVMGMSVYHLDKYFFSVNWVERNYEEFLAIQREIVNKDNWIIDGNSIRSLEMRWGEADLVVYFNISRVICYMRVLKRRFFRFGKEFDDRAEGCKEVIGWGLLKYMWNFERRVGEEISWLRAKYPEVVFKEVRNGRELSELKRELVGDRDGFNF